MRLKKSETSGLLSPIQSAAEVAVGVIRSWLDEHDRPSEVVLCAFNAAAVSALSAELEA